MPRISRALVIGFPHRITQRGNYQQCIFEDKDGFISTREGLLGRQLNGFIPRGFRKKQ